MRDTTHPPAGWDDAFARLPAESPPPGGWQALAGRLDSARAPARRRTRAARWAAIAAVLALVATVPWLSRDLPAPDGSMPPSNAIAMHEQASAIAELQAESAQLETLLAHARDGDVATGSAATVAAQMEAQLAAIDGALAAPGLAPAQVHALWDERVASLQALVSFEGTRRWLAVNGTQYDGVLVQVN